MFLTMSLTMVLEMFQQMFQLRSLQMFLSVLAERFDPGQSPAC